MTHRAVQCSHQNMLCPCHTNTPHALACGRPPLPPLEQDFDCSCTCDLTAGLCDYNCCCDHECTAAEITAFRESEAGCLPEGPEEATVTMCTEADRLNERFPLTYTGTAEESARRLLCVAYDNSDVKGTFFEDPGDFEGDASVFTEDKGTKDYSYGNYFPVEGVSRRSGEVRTSQTARCPSSLLIPLSSRPHRCM